MLALQAAAQQLRYRCCQVRQYVHAAAADSTRLVVNRRGQELCQQTECEVAMVCGAHSFGALTQRVRHQQEAGRLSHCKHGAPSVSCTACVLHFEAGPGPASCGHLVRSVCQAHERLAWEVLLV